MLNELAIVVRGLKNAQIPFAAPNPRIQSVGKKKRLLVVRFNPTGKPVSFVVSGEEETALLSRYVQNPGDKASPSFPAFNLPIPFRSLVRSESQSAFDLIKQLAEQQKRKNTPTATLIATGKALLAASAIHSFKKSEAARFKRCTTDLAGELTSRLASAPSELTNLKLLAELFSTKPVTLAEFIENICPILAEPSGDISRRDLLLSQEMLFGPLDWRTRKADIGSTAYFTEKTENDEGSQVSFYLELSTPNLAQPSVSHPKTWEHLSNILEASDASIADEGNQPDDSSDAQGEGVDAFTGDFGPLETGFTPPNLARLGPFKPFSLNTRECKCLLRYGLHKNASFPVSKESARSFYNALRHLGSEQRLGVSCKPIKNGRVKRVQGKTVEGEDLLIAYLEEAPDFDENLAEMFGGEARKFTDADFSQRTEQVLRSLEGKLKGEPDLKVELLALRVLNQGNNQLSLHRKLRAADVVRAARLWQAAVKNAPKVTIIFPEAKKDEPVERAYFAPDPLDVASTLNRLWSEDAICGKMEPSFQRAVTVSDAYEVFFASGPLAHEKTKQCLGVLLARMALPLGRLGTVKASRLWTKEGRPTLPVKLRLQCAKVVSLLGIFLQQLKEQKETFMKEPTYQVGRLLALADSLHLHYCKYVRTSDEKRKAGMIDAPSELLGNSLFNFALDQPVTALARLAERIKPYKGWADTYFGEESNLVHWFVRQMAVLNVDDFSQLEVQQRMTDTDKAKLLLGYLADHSQTDSEIK